jgi:hypothetical protein
MRYEFIVRDRLPDELAEELPELSCIPYPTGGSTLFGPVQDEADVLTLLTRLHSLGLSVIQMRRLPD